MKKRPFFYFWIAKTSISLADVVYLMVLTTFIYQNTGSAFIASIFPLLNALARIAAGCTAPLLLYRFRFSKLLVSLQFIKAVLISIWLTLILRTGALPQELDAKYGCLFRIEL